MWKFIKNLFGFGEDAVVAAPMNITPPPPLKPKYTRNGVRAKRYYKNNGRFYDREGDSIVEDAMLLVILIDMFDNGEIDDSNNFTAPEEDILDMDVSDIEVEASTPDITYEARNDHIAPTPTPITPEREPEPSYSEPERTSSYSSGSSDSGSSYDSGGSDD